MDTLESRWKALHEDLTEQSSYYSSSYSSWLNYGSSFFSNIVLNVHLKISSVHIRFEDQTTIPGCPFATGIIIQSLFVCSTDENWQPKYVTRDNLSDKNLLFKKIELESFSVYFDTDTTLNGQQSSSSNSSSTTTTSYSNSNSVNKQKAQLLVDLMRNNCKHNQTRSGQFVEHDYIVAPVNGKCHLKRNSSEISLKSCKQPRTVIDVQVEQVPIMMTAIQYKHLLDWSLAFQTSKTLWRYRKWRPMITKHSHHTGRNRTMSSTTSTVSDGDDSEEYEDDDIHLDSNNHNNNIRVGFEPKIWWHFAVNANLEEYRQRRQHFNWHFILQRSRDIVAYHRAYLHYLLYPELFSKDMRCVKDRVENELSLDEICSIREIVFTESDRILKEHNQQFQMMQQQRSPDNESSSKVQPDSQQQPSSSSSWFLPYLLSKMYYNYSLSSSSDSGTQISSENNIVSNGTSLENEISDEDVEDNDDLEQSSLSHYPKNHRRTLSTSSTSSMTDDIFLLRDAVFCQFNFQIRNSSFQLIAFSSDQNNKESCSGIDSNGSKNLLLEFEFTKMKIGVDITNPNAYACLCHMNQGYRRRQGFTTTTSKSTSSSMTRHFINVSLPQKFLTQNELNMLQFNLNFECRNLNLTLLRTDQNIISDEDVQKLATAQLTGGAMMFVFSQSFISIDGKLDSLEIMDLVTKPQCNKHRRVLSIGQKQQQSLNHSSSNKDENHSSHLFQHCNPISEGYDSSYIQNTASGGFLSAIPIASNLEKAFSFSLSRQFLENILRLNIEMASFCYVHSPILVNELSLCRECFSDVLEAYFSRSFKERVKAATTEMLRGIVVSKSSTNSASNTDDTIKDSTASNINSAQHPSSTTMSFYHSATASNNNNRQQNMLPHISKNNRTNNRKSHKQMSPFVDNFKLTIFIRSPVIIVPISPSNYEVVVFHLGHMLLNNHSHSTDIIIVNSANKNKENMNPTTTKSGNQFLSSIKSNNLSVGSAHTITTTTTSSPSHSYNAEIRDLSIYSLDCMKNIREYEKRFPGIDIQMTDIYFCDTFGVPILQKTVIEIVLEKKILMSSLESSVGGVGISAASKLSSLTTRLSTSPKYSMSSSQPGTTGSVVGKTSTSSLASQDDLILVDGLNIISTVNSIDAFRPPKKFSIREHLYPEMSTSSGNNYIYHGVGGSSRQDHHYIKSTSKQELVLSVEVSAIDVRFSYTDLLVFCHIVSTLMPEKRTNTATDIFASNQNNTTTVNGDVVNHDDEHLNMEELEELFSKEFKRLSRKKKKHSSKKENEFRRIKSSEDVRFDHDDGVVNNEYDCYDDEDEFLNSSVQVRLSELDPIEFKLSLDKLQDLGFECSDSLRALALTGGDVIEAAFLLSNETKQQTHKTNSNEHIMVSSDDNQSQCTFSTERSTSLQQLSSTTATSNHSSSMNYGGGDVGKGSRPDSVKKRLSKTTATKTTTNSLLSSLSVIEIRILAGSVRIIDDCNQLDIPLIELGIREFRLIQLNTSPVIEANAQTNFYCDYYNSHLSGWEPVIEHCQVAFSWKMHHQRCHLKSMLNNVGSYSTGYNRQVPKRKLALKIDIKKMFNLNISRALLDLIDKVRSTWIQDIINFMQMPKEQRSFRHRQPFIPFTLKNETGSDMQLRLPQSSSNKSSVLFSTGKAADLITHCDLCNKIDVSSGQVVCFDLVDQQSQQQQRLFRSAKSSTVPQKITVKVDGWSLTFPLSIEREGTFIRHIISESYFNQSAILVFEISLLPSAVKLITVKSSLQVANRTTKNVELNFANTAMFDVKTSYIIAPNGLFPVPLKLLYARMQLRPCDLGLGACRTPINWNHVRRYGEQHCSLQICTPITHTSQASYSNSSPYVVSVLVERNSIGALIESRNSMYSPTSLLSSSSSSVSASIRSSSLSSMIPATSSSGNIVYGQVPLYITIPSHTITLLPPLQLANRLPYELKFSISNTTVGTIRSGDDHSVHYVSPLEPFALEFSMEHFPKSKPITITPGATKDYSTHIDMYDTKGRLLVLNAQISVLSGSQQPCNAMTIIIYSPYWIINRSGLPLIFSQEGVYSDSAGQTAEHERARSISPLLYSFSDVEAPKYCIMRLGRMTESIEPRWCNFFMLEGTFYRRLRVTETPFSSTSSVVDPLSMSPDKTSTAHYLPVPTATERFYEFGIDIRNGRDRYAHTKIVTIAPRYQIENLTSYKLEFAQRCMVDSFGARGADSLYSPPTGTSASRSSSFSTGPHNSYYYSDSQLLHQTSTSSSIHQQHQHMINNTTATMMSTATWVISALPKSNMPFHWPSTNMPKLLCVRIASFEGCLWSGSFAVGTEPSSSLQLNIRDDSGRSYFIRVEILLQNATYFIVFTEANSLPPPIRVENFSQVPIEFFQAGITNMLKRTSVRPNSSVSYALDEPSLPSHLTICAPGGSYSTYDLNSFAPGDNLTYDNFYYIAFEETFVASCLMSSSGYGLGGGSYVADLDDDEQLMLMMLAGPDFFGFNERNGSGGGSQMLVLDVPDETEMNNTMDNGNNNINKTVVLACKERGKRSQLWRIDMQNRIIHEGSSPPLEPGIIHNMGFADVKFHHRYGNSLMVLDVANDENDDDEYLTKCPSAIPLVIRKMNPARELTQTWIFTADGRLRCAKYKHLFVQPLSTISTTNLQEFHTQTPTNFLFRAGTPAYLMTGLLEENTITINDDQQHPPIKIPREQAIMKQKMRKGSGILNISIVADGPSRVLRIKDQQMSANGRHLHLVQHYSYGSPYTMGHFGIERSISGSSNTGSGTNGSTDSFFVRMLRQMELELSLHIDSIGISVINKVNEELVYLFIQRVLLETILNPSECRLNCVVQNFQVCAYWLNVFIQSC